MTPCNPSILAEIFYICGIEFMGPFPSSFGNEYISLAVDYVSNQVKVVSTRTNDAKVVMKFLRDNVFTGFSMPRAILVIKAPTLTCLRGIL